jgi:F-type H+-transporting ATPase subunit delta
MSDVSDLVHHPTVFDDESRHIGRVYAEALWNAAEKSNQTSEALSEIEALVLEVFRKDPGLELFLTSAAISKERKAGAIDRAFAGKATDVFTHFLHVLNNHGRLDMLRAIAQAYRTLYDRKSGHVVVHVRSAVPLTDAERDRIREDVRATTATVLRDKLNAIFVETVDPSILGGLVIRIQDWVYDASVRTRLQNIRNQIIERSSHAIQSGRDRFSP